MHWFTAISCPGIPTNAVSCPASGCSEGQCCLGGAGYGLSPDGTSCGLCPAGSYKSITGTGKCLPCAEGAGSKEGWTACMPGAVTWKLGSKGDSCDTTCSAAKDVGPCVEEAFKAEWSIDLMKTALVDPSKGLGSESVLKCDTDNLVLNFKCDKARQTKWCGAEPFFGTADPFYGTCGLLTGYGLFPSAYPAVIEVGNSLNADGATAQSATCHFPEEYGHTSTCAASFEAAYGARRVCPCGCPFGTTASAGTSGPCLT